jgi:hypothetical protein
MTFSPDIANSMLELVSVFVMCLNVRRLIIDKQLKGISIWSSFYGYAWALWYNYFCFASGQLYSATAGCVFSAVQTVWVIILLYYKWQARSQIHIAKSSSE